MQRLSQQRAPNPHNRAWCSQPLVLVCRCAINSPHVKPGRLVMWRGAGPHCPRLMHVSALGCIRCCATGSCCFLSAACWHVVCSALWHVLCCCPALIRIQQWQHSKYVHARVAAVDDCAEPCMCVRAGLLHTGCRDPGPLVRAASCWVSADLICYQSALRATTCTSCMHPRMGATQPGTLI